jgi:hypothetical protein
MSLNDDVDGWIAQLMGCKPLSETEVKKLCDKVSAGPLEAKDRVAAGLGCGAGCKRNNLSEWSEGVYQM